MCFHCHRYPFEVYIWWVSTSTAMARRERSSAIGGVLHVAASTIGGFRTESWSYRIVRTAVKRRSSECLLRHRVFDKRTAGHRGRGDASSPRDSRRRVGRGFGSGQLRGQLQAAAQRLSGDRGAFSLTDASECAQRQAFAKSCSGLARRRDAAQRECSLAACPAVPRLRPMNSLRARVNCATPLTRRGVPYSLGRLRGAGLPHAALGEGQLGEDQSGSVHGRAMCADGRTESS